MDSLVFVNPERLSAYFGLQKVIDTQLFKRYFELSTERQHRHSVVPGDGIKNMKQPAIILLQLEMISHKPVMRRKLEQRRCFLKTHSVLKKSSP